ncbi:MAG TPA: EVE domain-containing protein, partial [Polyangiaceae bacterium]|nr:EVE domain-containing protein [Polyangiaceae bacterium]
TRRGATADEGDWSAVDIAPYKPLTEPVTLAAIRGDKRLQEFALLRRSRLSVVPATRAEFSRVLELGKTKI